MKENRNNQDFDFGRNVRYCKTFISQVPSLKMLRWFVNWGADLQVGVGSLNLPWSGACVGGCSKETEATDQLTFFSGDLKRRECV